MVEVADEGQMEAGEVHSVVLEEGELVQKLLGRMLMLAVSRVDEGGLHGKAVPPRVLGALLVQVAAQALDLAAHDEDRVAVAGEHVEGVGIALALVDRGRGAHQLGDLGVVELGSVPEALLRPCTVLQEDFVDAEVGIVDPEEVKRRLVIRQDGILQLPDLLEEVAPLLDGEVLDDREGSATKHVYTHTPLLS